MIRVPCVCGRSVSYENPAPGLPVRCACGVIVRPVWGLGTDALTASFTGRLIVRAGPNRKAEHYLLGGDVPIEAGKLPGKPILLNGASVSRGHCRFVRPGDQWIIEDQNSTNGIFVDGSRTKRSPLKDGTVIDVGEFEMHFATVAPVSNSATAPASAPRSAGAPMVDSALGLRTSPPSADSSIALGFRDDEPALPVARNDDADELVELDLVVEGELELAEEKNDLYDMVASFDPAPKKSSPTTSPSVMASRKPLGVPTMASATRASAGAAVKPGPAVICPSCSKSLPPGSKICVECGIYTATGRPLVTAKGLDEDDLAITAHNWISTVSWVMRFGLFPIASEAFGTFKPRAIKAIAWTTVAASLLFFFAFHFSGSDDVEKMNSSVAGLMLWAGHKSAPAAEPAVEPSPAAKGADEVASSDEDEKELFTADELAELQRIENKAKAGRTLTSEDRRTMERAERKLRAAGISDDELQPAFKHDFQPHQLLTNTLLHDPGGNVVFGWIPLAYHLGGNLVFMLVFGLAINSQLGDLKTAIIYPVLAVLASWINMVMVSDQPFHPSLGASGAVMGLAGMYFVLFPTSKLRMVIWWRWGFIGKFALHYKLFAVRGFWMLLLWIAWNDVVPVILAKQLGGSGDGVAHWAHLGGFSAGAGVALILLLARQSNTRGADILSVALGRFAWPILGKPAMMKKPPADLPRAVPMSYPTVVAEA